MDSWLLKKPICRHWHVLLQPAETDHEKLLALPSKPAHLAWDCLFK